MKLAIKQIGRKRSCGWATEVWFTSNEDWKKKVGIDNLKRE
jgi:hypothetical protein